MTSLGNRRRRRLAAGLLGLALAMLLAGQTVLRAHLQGIPFLVYWLLCMVFSFGAMLTAVRELAAVNRQARAARKDLLRQTWPGFTTPSARSGAPASDGESNQPPAPGRKNGAK